MGAIKIHGILGSHGLSWVAIFKRKLASKTDEKEPGTKQLAVKGRKEEVQRLKPQQWRVFLNVQNVITNFWNDWLERREREIKKPANDVFQGQRSFKNF